jgi:hypothetical protein
MIDRRKLLALSATGAFGAGLASSVRVAGATMASPAKEALSAASGCLSAREFGAKGDGVTDDTAAVQRAIDHVRDRAIARSDTSYLPSIVLPAGHYKLTDTINTFPWVKLRSAGGVLLDFQWLPAAQNGITCRNETMLAAGDLCYPGNRSPFLDGSGGTISVLGPGASRSRGSGIVMGNRDARFVGEVRDAGGHNVIVTGWRGALHIDPVNTYLNVWTSCRFEQNRDEAISVASPSGPSVNSGERMTFYDCTFSGSGRALNIDSDSHDFVFDACSFDFLRDVIYFGPRSRYGTVALSHCHIEGVDGSIVNAEKAGDRIRVAIDHSTVLPRRWHASADANAPRQLVTGHCSFSAVAVEFRFEAPAQDAGQVLIGDDVHIETLNGLNFHGFDALPSRNRSLNADARFRQDPAGTPAERLSHWQAAAGTQSVGSAAIAKAGANEGVHAFVMKAPPKGAARFVLSARSTFAVRPGETLCAAAGISSKGASGNCEVSIDFLSAGGSAISRAAYTGSKGRGVVALRTIVPAGASFGLLSAGFSDWKGELQLTTLVAWIAA